MIFNKRILFLNSNCILKNLLKANLWWINFCHQAVLNDFCFQIWFLSSPKYDNIEFWIHHQSNFQICRGLITKTIWFEFHSRQKVKNGWLCFKFQIISKFSHRNKNGLSLVRMEYSYLIDSPDGCPQTACWGTAQQPTGLYWP